MKNIIRIILTFILFTSCGGGDDGPAPTEKKELGAFDLVFPDNDQICTEGTDMDDNMVAINFLWTESENAISYELKITNQETNDIISVVSSKPEKEVTLKKGSQFTWIVTAKLDATIKKESSSWNFYSTGVVSDNYAPFPAEINISDNTDGTVKIEWASTDLDNDITGYDIYLDTKRDADLLLSDTANTSISSYAIEYGTIYYVKVVTKDTRGNSATSTRSFKF